MASCKPETPVSRSDSAPPPPLLEIRLVPSDLNYDRTCRNPRKIPFVRESSPWLRHSSQDSPKRIFIARERIPLSMTTRRETTGPRTIHCTNGPLRGVVTRSHYGNDRRSTIAQCRRYAPIFTRVLPCRTRCRIGRRVLLVQVMPDWLSVARPSVFLRRCRLFLSLSLSSSAFREEATLPARPQEHMFTNNKPRGTLLKNQQTERIAPPRFDRQTLVELI